MPADLNWNYKLAARFKNLDFVSFAMGKVIPMNQFLSAG